MSSLAELPRDACATIFSFLPPHSVVALAACCHSLKSTALEECVWQQKCEEWLHAQQLLQPAAGSPPAAATELLLSLRLPTYRALYSALHQLGGWPAGGMWFATSDQAQPRGRLLVCQLDRASGALQMLQPRPSAAAAWPAGSSGWKDCWELAPVLSIQAVADEAGGQASLEVSSPSDALHRTLEIAPRWQRLAMHASHEPRTARPPHPLPGARVLPPSGASPRHHNQSGEGGSLARRGSGSSSGSSLASSSSGPLASLAQYLGVQARRVRLASMEFERVQLAPAGPAGARTQPAAAAGEGGAAGMALLRRCQGVYFGSYGPHGLEVLSLTACPSPAGQAEAEAGPMPLPRHCPIRGPRLQALKLTGDPNVPALRHSFVVDAVSCRLGRYSADQDDPFAPAGGPARPCLSFFPGGATVVLNLEERPVAARFRAAGCINRVPGVWQPEWVPATCLLYDAPPGSALHGALTVVFEDEDQPFRHAIDYHEFPLASELALESSTGSG